MDESQRRALAIGGPIAAVVVLSFLMWLVSVDLTIAALVLAAVVAGSALLGPLAAGISIVVGVVALAYAFVPPRASFSIHRGQDVGALFVFVIAGLVIAGAVLWVDRLRAQAELAERVATTRIELAGRLAAGEDPWRVAVSAGDRIEELFGLEECRADLDAAGRLTVFMTPSAQMLTPDNQQLLSGLVKELGASLDRIRLEQAAAPERDDAGIE